MILADGLPCNSGVVNAAGAVQTLPK